MISDDKSTMEEFEEIIRLDPTLVVRLLRLVNSAYYSLRNKVTSISEAVVFIGSDSLRNMVVVEALANDPNGFISRLDKDGDGGVSAAEFDGPAHHFDRMDRNQDGIISADEAPMDPPPGKKRPRSFKQ